MTSDSRRVADSRCPACAKRLNSVSLWGPGKTPKPRAGDLTLCFGCGAALRFARKRLVELEADEFAALVREDEEFRLAVRKMREFIVLRDAGLV